MKLLVSLLAASTPGVRGETCDAGYQLVGNETHNECTDINECENGGCLGPAANFCNNLPGSWVCGCSAGYTLGDDQQTCSDINECDNNPCSANASCDNTVGSFTCTCENGYSKNDQDVCENDDDCDPNPCDGDCTDGIADYTCSCPAGQVTDPNNSDKCVDANECETGSNDCDPVRGTCFNHANGFTCGCKGGYELQEGSNNCIDIDECDGSDLCSLAPDGKTKCANTIRSYECVCPDGSSYNEDSHQCEDNEDNCKPGACGANEKCTDEVDGFSCACEDGYEQDDSGACVNTNECFEGTHDCGYPQDCRDTAGSWACDCPSGWKNVALEGEPTDCVNINECTEGSLAVFSCNEPNKGVCVNDENGAYSCECDAGWEDNNGVCTDIVDCPANCDQANGGCTDGDGSYECWCNEHYELADNGDCNKIDYCSGSYDCSHIANSVCQNDPVGSYSCECTDEGVLTDVYKMNEWGNATTSELDYQHCVLPQEEEENDGEEQNDQDGQENDSEQEENDSEQEEEICDDGYHMVDGSCADKNECNGDGVFTCNESGKGRCVNTPGGYYCECSPGYFDANEDGSCVGIDDCQPDSCPSDRDCIDEHMGTSCECKPGYAENNDGNCEWVDRCPTSGLNCNATSVNVCYDAGEGSVPVCGDSTCVEDCGENASCNGEFDNFACECNSGFEGVNCTDINECETGSVGYNTCAVGPANSKCVNTAGSWYCQCNAGYENDEDMICVSTTDCDGTEVCDMANRGQCEEREGAELYACGCDDGYSFSGVAYDSPCVNDNECTSETICDHKPHSSCNDNDGSYTCDCDDGWTALNATHCVNINECDGDNDCDNGVCEDNDGSYTCTCNAGYFNKDNEQSCSDVNECIFENSATYTCQEANKNTCINNDGGYSCTCNTGWLENDSGDCVDRDMCASEGMNCDKDADCTDDGDGTGFTCTCRDGFVGNGYSCDDENECDTMPDYCINKPNSHCVNTPLGNGAECVCNEYYQEDGTGQCEDIDECNGDDEFICGESNRGQCVNQENGYTCVCNEGFDDNNAEGTCQNRNECLLDEPCDANASCEDNDGGYSCTCNAGFAGNGYTCEDIDECKSQGCSDENSTCENNVGGYACRCNSGYKEVSNTCVNIDECNEGENPCIGNYVNETMPGRSGCNDLEGSYECTCAPGLVEDDNGECTNVDECTAGGYTCGPNGKCVDIVLRDGSVGFTCSCEDGFQGGYFAGAFFCSDINECTRDTDPIDCGFGGRCSNTLGGFNCLCPSGFRLNDDGLCEDIDECGDGTYSCGTDDGNRGTCHNIDGDYECNCNQGWKDPVGNQTVCQPINECQNGNSDCDANAQCNDVESYLSNNWVGFTCSCNEFYTGDGHTCEDINECEEQTDDCDRVTEVCQNAIGTGWTCGCASGYDATGENGACENINECDLGSPCDVNALCHDTEGSYECECQGEYEGDGQIGNCNVCPSTECWTWDAQAKECKLKSNSGDNACTSITCDSNSMTFGWNSALFGLEKGDAPSFVDPNVYPDYNATLDKFTWTIGLEGEGVSYDVVNGNVEFNYFLALTGTNRARSGGLSVDGREIDLGAKTLFTSPFGVGVNFVCRYPTTVSVTSEGFTVEAVDLTYEREGVGSFANAFSLSIGDGSSMQFILGQILDVEVAWDQQGLDDLVMSMTGCSVAHGDKNIAIVKGGCYSEALEVVAGDISSRSSKFTYKLFKGVGVNSVDQTLTCEAVIFKSSVSDPRPADDSDCPNEGNDSFFLYKSP